MKKSILTLISIILLSISSYAAISPIVTIAKFESSKEVIHSSDFGGKITNIYYTNGDFVKKGTVIMTIENDQVKANYKQVENQYLLAKANYEKTKNFSKDQQMLNLERSEKSLTSAKMSLQKAQNGAKQEQLDQLKLNVETSKVNYETTKKTFDKNQTLYNSQSISEQSYLQIKNQLESADNAYKGAQKALTLAKKGADIEDIKTLKASLDEAQGNYKVNKNMVDQKIWDYDISSAQSAMNAAKAVYDLSKQKYNELSVVAECSGMIVSLDIDEGNKVAPAKSLFSIISIDTMTLKVGIDEKYIANFNKNSKVDVFVSSLNKHFQGNIASINPRANEKTKKFEVKIKVNNTNHLIKEGMHGEVTIGK